MEEPPSRNRRTHYLHAQERLEVTQSLFIDLQSDVRLNPSPHSPKDIPDVGAELGGVDAQGETEVYSRRSTGDRGQVTIRARRARVVAARTPVVHQSQQELYTSQPPTIQRPFPTFRSDTR